eukprot:183748-Chlamydomonas_euryale.AAC.1
MPSALPTSGCRCRLPCPHCWVQMPSACHPERGGGLPVLEEPKLCGNGVEIVGKLLCNAPRELPMGRLGRHTPTPRELPMCHLVGRHDPHRFVRWVSPVPDRMPVVVFFWSWKKLVWGCRPSTPSPHCDGDAPQPLLLSLLL